MAMRGMLNVAVLAAVVMAGGAAGAFADDTPATEKAEKAELTATLVANKESLPLDPTQSGEAFRDSIKELQKGHKKLPAASTVDFTLKITNTTAKDIDLTVGGDASRLELKLEGKGALTVENMVMMTREFRVGSPTTIAAGKSYEVPIKALAFGMRGVSNLAWFTEAGDYKLTATLVALRGEQQVKLTSEPVAFKVEAVDEKKEK